MGRAAQCIRSCLGDTIGRRNLTPAEWVQSSLPLRLGGLGIKDPEQLCSVARVASSITFLHRAGQMQLPDALIQLPPDWQWQLAQLLTILGPKFEPVNTWATSGQAPQFEDHHRSQKWCTTRVHTEAAQAMSSSVSLRDRCRLNLQAMPNVATWMEVTPSRALGTKFTGTEYQLLLRWWLGMPLVAGSATDCPCCGQTMDVYGDHLVSCKYNQPTQRHHAVRDALANTLRECNIACQVEVAVGGNRRPADVAVLGVDARGPLAIDLFIHDPLCLSQARDPSAIKASLSRGEQAKVDNSSALCHSNGFLFCPMGWHPWGGLGPQGGALLRRLEKLVAGDSQGWARSRKIAAFRQPIWFALMQLVAQQLCPALEAHGNFALPVNPAAGPKPLLAGTQSVSHLECAGWNEPNREEDEEDGERPPQRRRC